MSDDDLSTPELAASDLKEEARTANGIYGVIVGSGVMAAAHGDSVGRLAVAVLVTLLIYWAAERYSRLMARRIVLGRGLTRAELRTVLSDGWEVVTTSFIPLTALVGTHLLGVDLTGSVFAALACSTVLLSLSGWRVGREAHLGLRQSFTSAAVAGAFGAVMIVLKATLH